MMIEQVVNGLTLGSTYALLAVGFTMVYGIVRLINFAHGDTLMAAAFVSLMVLRVLQPLHLPAAVLLAAAALVAIPFAGLMGVLIMRLAYKPVLKVSMLATTATAVGVTIVAQNVAFVIFGPEQYTYPNLFPKGGVDVLGVRLLWIQLSTIAITVLLMVALSLYVKRTKMGVAMRATAQDPIAANLMGIDTNRAIELAFLLGSMMAGAGGIMLGSYYGLVNFQMGLLPGLKAFTACVVGGIGSIPGAALGGLLMGMLEALSTAYISSSYKDALTLAVLFVFVVLRPNGLLGSDIFTKRA
jgi:branched-chain amino acid transport system permease protein